jgi:hypothetical protein
LSIPSPLIIMEYKHMSYRTTSRSATYALIAAAAMGLATWTPAAHAQQGVDWPRSVKSGKTEIIVYEPQVDSLQGVTLTSHLAVSVKRPTDAAPLFGALWVTAMLDVDRDRDMARIRSIKIDRTRFPDTTEADVATLTRFLEGDVPKWDLTISLKTVRAGLEAPGAGDDTAYKNDPPRIVLSDAAAILVNIDGQPRMQAVGNGGYQRVVNTAVPVILDPASKRYWLFGSTVWYSTNDLISGTWRYEKKAPQALMDLVKLTDSEQSAATPEGKAATAKELAKAKIIVATTPTELIVTEGPAKYTPAVPGGELLYVSNTGSNIFMEVATQRHFVVLSGRWYAARSLSGPWAYIAPEELPGAFAKIPASSPKADVLAFVAGTDEAKDAVMDTLIPQTAEINRGDAKIEVTYDGAPRFTTIQGSSVQYAENTSHQVVRTAGRFYLCEQGAWYVSSSATGPWVVSDHRPDGIDTVPPSSPVYNTRYVQVYQSTPQVVYVGYLPGYMWTFPSHGVVIYGTGWAYRPWVGPIYYPRPVTWGYHVRYTSWGGWSFGMSWSSGWYGMSAHWGPAWGGGWYVAGGGFWGRPYYHGGGGWFGPGGYRPLPPRPPVWRPGPSRPIRPLQRSNNLYARPNNPVRPLARPSAPLSRPGGQLTRPANRLPNNVYSDNNGNVHRNTGGGWQTRENRTWKPSNPGSSTPNARPSVPSARPAPQRPAGRPAPTPAPRGGGSLGQANVNRGRVAAPSRGMRR